MINFGTSIVGSGLTVDGTCIPVTTTTVETPLIYTGAVRTVEPTSPALARRDALQDQILFSNQNQNPAQAPFDQDPTPEVDGVVDKLPGAGVFYPPVVIKTATAPSSASAEPLIDPSVETTAEAPTSAESTDRVSEGQTSAPQASGAATATYNSPVPSSLEDQPPSQASTQASTNAVGSPPIRPTTSDVAEASTGQIGSMSTSPFSGAQLTATTCVPLSMVIPSYLANSTSESPTSPSTASVSVPLQTGNPAASLGSFVHFGWLFGLMALLAIV